MTNSRLGMLFVAADINSADEDDFNKWYDHEHVEERVRMGGVRSAARYVSVAGGPKYLALYWADSIAVFAGGAYSQAFVNQTPWSIKTMSKMLAPRRRVGTVIAHRGQGSGGWVAVLPLNKEDDLNALEAAGLSVAEKLSEDIAFVQSYIIIPNEELSRPLPLEDISTRTIQPILVIESRTSDSSSAALDIAANLLGVKGANAARYQLNWKLNSEELR
ncbi:hypothetical protein E8E95_10245 [Pseudomonas sp. BN414]|uniref:DUF4286 family protein n=1 Tax=Pseudomonas sp. BN414 TaxID=2567888 RepID=UPI0024586FCC|nr:DUF4286 family protein [Pseudomonas sp. BN414]MDH4567059.1 hypothetical protein [Pseudomonas sp. BN414]